MNPANPAKRIHNLLKQLKETDRTHSLLQAWAKIFGIDSSNHIEILKNILSLNEMLDNTETLIKTSVDNPNSFISKFANIRAVFSPLNLQRKAEELTNQLLTDEVMTRLEFCDLELNKIYPGQITEIDLSEIEKNLAELINTIRTSKADEQLRKILLSALLNVQNAISLYWIYGVEHLKENMQKLFGVLLTEENALKKENENTPELIKSFGRIIIMLDSALSIITNAPPIITTTLALRWLN